MYKVIFQFKDLKDNNYLYKVGDKFPRKGINVSPERIKELSSDSNKLKKPLIEEVEEETKKNRK